MALIQIIFHNLLSFVLIISAIVFVHEFGHFLVARLCKVKVDEFAIGFGFELLGFTDKKGTRWKICPIPFGGYVKMFGDRNAASMADSEILAQMSAADRKKSFIGKTVWQRFAIVLAGPVFNFILTIFLFTALFWVNGLSNVVPVIDEVVAESAAAAAGLQKGDRIVAIDSKVINSFDEIREVVATSAGKELRVKILRGSGPRNECGVTAECAVKAEGAVRVEGKVRAEGESIELLITPKIQTTKNIFGEEMKVGMLGISASSVTHQDLNLGQSFVTAIQETYKMTVAIFKALGELVTGQRSLEELGGPVKIAKYSGKTVEMGIAAVAWFAAMISLNLGVMNLLPIPVLDGGHLFFYLIEAIRGKPLAPRTQELGFRVGLSLVLALMLFTTFNDIRQIVGGM